VFGLIINTKVKIIHSIISDTFVYRLLYIIFSTTNQLVKSLNIINMICKSQNTHHPKKLKKKLFF